MSKETDHPVSARRGAGRSTGQPADGVTALVESLHQTLATFGGMIPGARRIRSAATSGLVSDNIRRITGLVGTGLEAALQRLARIIDQMGPSRERDIVVCALNGLVGDYLAATDNPLAVEMQLRRGGERLTTADDDLRAAVCDAGGRIALMIHGNAASDWQWQDGDHDHGAALARDLGYVPIYLRYNSGLHISENGQELAELLETFVADLGEPVDLTIVGHSMGGLVARSAHYYGRKAGHDWIEDLEAHVFLGTPHHGVPIERLGSRVDSVLESIPYSAPLSRLSKLRSAGITDLGWGNLLHEDWAGRDRFERTGDRRRPVPLPEGVACYAIAATRGEANADSSLWLRWDGAVTVDSALGRHPDPDFDLGIPATHQKVVGHLGHIGLVRSPEAYAAMKEWLSR